MVDKKGAQEKPVKRWSRSKEMLRTLTVASLLARFVDDNLTAHGLVDVLDDMAKEVRVNNWETVKASPAMAALRSAPRSERVWFGLPYGERLWIVGRNPGGITAHTLDDLRDAAKKVIPAALERIHANVNATRDPFDGLNDDALLLDWLDKVKALVPGRVRFHRGEMRRGVVLEESKPFGEWLFEVDAVPMALLDEFLQAGGWKYLTRCAGCDRLFLPRRPDAHTCSPRCRKRRERDKLV